MFQIKIRAVVGIMIFFGYFLMYVVRYNLSVHIVDMAQVLRRKEYLLLQKNFNDSDVTRTILIDAFSDDDYWDDLKVAGLFAAYHIGYCICFPIFHNLGDRFGPTWVVGSAGFISGIMNCLTPPALYYEYWALLIVRIITGFCAGAMQPSMVQLLRHWVPPIERNHFMWAYCGITTGTFSTFLICAGVHYYSRWPVGFYICGGCQILWFALWITIITDYPVDHSCISQKELNYLNNTIGTVFTLQVTNKEAPWSLILRSKAFWSLCILNFGYAWMIIAMSIYGPLYYSVVAEYSIYNAAVLTALPFLLRLVLGTITIQLFHWYKHNRKIRRIKHIRKYFIVVSHVIPGALVACTWFTRVIPGPVFLTIAVTLTAAGMDLTLDICYEIAPNYANSVATLIKIIGNTPGILVSFCVGHITKTFKNLPIVWKHLWCCHAMILCLTGVIFLIWGETKIQQWNNLKRSPNTTGRNFRRVLPKPSTMSDITEVDEDNISHRASNPYSRKTLLSFMNIKL